MLQNERLIFVFQSLETYPTCEPVILRVHVEELSDNETEASVMSEAEKDDLKAQLEESLGKKELKRKLAIEAKKVEK